MRFVVDARGLYVKEKMAVIRNRMKQIRAKEIKKRTNSNISKLMSTIPQ